MTSEPLIRLIYVSTARSGLTGQDIRQILMSSWTGNLCKNISGLLYFDGRQFLQSLEGPVNEVMSTYESIASDTRHEHLRSMGQTRTRQRLFPDWDMGYTDYRLLDQADLEPWLEDGVLNYDRLDEDQALKLLIFLSRRVYAPRERVISALDRLGLRQA